MRNEPNFQKSQMIVTLAITIDYNEKSELDTWSKRTQTNPILPASAGKIAPLFRMPFILMGLGLTCPERSRRVEPILLVGEEFELFDTQGVSQFLQGNQFKLADALLGHTEVLADLLQGLFVLSDKCADKAEVVYDYILFPLVKLIFDYLHQVVAGTFDGSEVRFRGLEITLNVRQRACFLARKLRAFTGGLSVFLGYVQRGGLAEPNAFCVVEIFNCFGKRKITLADKVLEIGLAGGVFSGDTDNQTKIRLDYHLFYLFGLSEVTFNFIELVARVPSCA